MWTYALLETDFFFLKEWNILKFSFCSRLTKESSEKYGRSIYYFDFDQQKKLNACDALLFYNFLRIQILVGCRRYSRRISTELQFHRDLNSLFLSLEVAAKLLVTSNFSRHWTIERVESSVLSKGFLAELLDYSNSRWLPLFGNFPFPTKHYSLPPR